MAADRRGLVKGPIGLAENLDPTVLVTRNSDADDNGRLLRSTSGSTVTYTILRDSSMELPLGAEIDFIQGGAGALTFAAGAGVTLQKAGAFAATPRAQHSRVKLTKVVADTWNLSGDIAVA